MSRVLVVDDDLASRSLLREILTPELYEVLEAEHGAQALEVLSKEKIDLVITDRSMPVLGGMELLKAIVDRKLKVPVIIVSAFGEESLWGQAIGLGAKEYLLKPFKAADVLKVVKSSLKGEKRK